MPIILSLTNLLNYPIMSGNIDRLSMEGIKVLRLGPNVMTDAVNVSDSPINVYDNCGSHLGFQSGYL